MIAGREFSTGSLRFCTSAVQRHWKLLFQTLFSGCIESKPGKQKNCFSSEQREDLFAVQNNNDPYKQKFGQTTVVPLRNTWCFLRLGFSGFDTNLLLKQNLPGSMYITPLGLEGLVQTWESSCLNVK